MKWNWKGIEIEGTALELLSLIAQETQRVELDVKKEPLRVESQISERKRLKNRNNKRWSLAEHKYLMNSWLGRNDEPTKKGSGKYKRRNNKIVAKFLKRTYNACQMHYKVNKLMGGIRNDK